MNQEFDSENRHSSYLVNQDLIVKKDTYITDSKIKVIAYASKALVFTYFIS